MSAVAGGELVVVGEGSVGVVPDRAVLQAAVNVMAPTAGEAVTDLGTRTAAVTAALASHGAGGDRVRTVGMTVQDFFDQAERKVTARVASTQLEVTVVDLDGFGELVTAAVAAAGDSFQVRAVQLTVADDRAARDEARRRAVADAAHQAAQLAAAAGVVLGPITAVTAGPAWAPPGRRRMSAAVALAAAGPPPVALEPGSLTVTERVTVTYQLV